MSEPIPGGGELASGEEAELERLLADVQRYPLQLHRAQWDQLRVLARDGDRRAQLDLLRAALGGAGTRPGEPERSHRAGPDSTVAELLDRLQDAERRAGAAAARVQALEIQVRQLQAQLRAAQQRDEEPRGRG